MGISGARPKILVVDDEQDIADLVSEHLALDFDVSQALNIQSACEAILKTKFDLIICDLHLPDSRGKSCVSYFRQIQFLGPVLLVTGSDEGDKAVKQALQDGATALIHKPFSLATVEAKVLETLKFSKAS